MKVRAFNDEEIQSKLQEIEMESIWDVEDENGQEIQFPFMITKVDSGKSKSMLDMLTLTINFRKGDDRQDIRYWLPFPRELKEGSSESTAEKKTRMFMTQNIKNLYYAVGLNEWYDEEKDMTGAELINKTGVATLNAIRDGQYPGNKVDKMIRLGEERETFQDDDLPF